MSDPSPNPESVFAQMIEIDSPEKRAAFLDQACGHDPDLRREMEKLVSDHFRAGQFLENPAVHGVATVEQPSAERPGTMIGPYKLMEQIGEGGMGLVFVAEQRQPVRRKVALKIIKPGMDSRQVVARFEAERQALAMMDHPNIAKVHDGGTTPTGRPYFVMELVRGVPITQYCDDNRLKPRERLELFSHVCAAVQHAHQKGIIHRDIKPSNVLVVSHDGTPVVKVIDFGVAKAIGQQLTDKTVYTDFAQFIGTPLYMSPEQAGQSGLDVDTRTDVYALGVLLYELLTGTTPFDKERLHKAGYDEIRRLIREEEPPKPSTRISTLGQAGTTVSAQRQSDSKQLCKMLRGELDWIVMKALEKDRNRRYESASALAADVQRYLHDEPVEACPPSTLYRLRKFTRRHRARLALAAIFGFALLFGGVTFLWREAQRAATAEAVLNDWNEAETFWNNKQWAKALRALERASDRLVGSGLTALQEKVDSRRQDVAVVTRLENAQAHLSLGIATQLQGRMREAEAAYREAIALKADYFEAHENLGIVLSRQKKFAEAVSAFTTAIDLSPDKGRRFHTFTHYAHALPVYSVAEAAARASDGQGDAAKLDPTERAWYRKRALDCLRAQIASAIAQLKSNSVKDALEVFQLMEYAQIDADFDTVRGAAALAKLPEAERRDWHALWEEVEGLRKQVTPRGFIQDWLVLSELVPYVHQIELNVDSEVGARALDLQQIPDERLIQPRAGDRVEVSGKTLVWKEHHSAEPYIDFGALLGPPSEYRLAYAVCYVHADADRTDLALRVGSDDQALIYLNGEEVYRKAKGGGLTLDGNEVPQIRLRQGTNVLVFKVVNQAGPGPLGSLHLVTKDGGALEGIEYRLAP